MIFHTYVSLLEGRRNPVGIGAGCLLPWLRTEAHGFRCPVEAAGRKCFPIKSGGLKRSYANVYQRVSCFPAGGFQATDPNYAGQAQYGQLIGAGQNYQ